MRTRNVGTRADYQKRASTFREHLRAQAQRPREEQEWPEDMDDWLGVRATVTCRTPGCPAGGRGDDREFKESADGRYQASCHGCGGRPEIVAEFDDGPVVLAEAVPPPTPDATPPSRGPVEDVEP